MEKLEKLDNAIKCERNARKCKKMLERLENARKCRKM